jgi:hypothetical protein
MRECSSTWVLSQADTQQADLLCPDSLPTFSQVHKARRRLLCWKCFSQGEWSMLTVPKKTLSPHKTYHLRNFFFF